MQMEKFKTSVKSIFGPDETIKRKSNSPLRHRDKRNDNKQTSIYLSENMMPQFLPGYAFTQALRHYSREHRTRKGDEKLTYLEMLYIHAIGSYLKHTKIKTFRPTYLSDNYLVSSSTITQCFMKMVRKQLLAVDYCQDKNKPRRKIGYSLTVKGWQHFQNINGLADRYSSVYKDSYINKVCVEKGRCKESDL